MLFKIYLNISLAAVAIETLDMIIHSNIPCFLFIDNVFGLESRGLSKLFIVSVIGLLNLILHFS